MPVAAVRAACDRVGELPTGVLRCRELPFDLALDDGFARTDAGTISTLAKTFPDGTQWAVQIAPMVSTPTAAQLTTQVSLAAKLLEPAAVATDELRFVAPSGRVVDTAVGLYGGYVVILAVAGMPGNAEAARGQAFLQGALTTAEPTPGFVPHGTVRIPTRAWRYTLEVTHDNVLSTQLFALPDVHAILGVRELAHPELCKQLHAMPATAFVGALGIDDLTVADATRLPDGLKVTTSDARPSIYALLCRRGHLTEVSLRGPAITPELRVLLDQLIQDPGSATRAASSSSDLAQ